MREWDIDILTGLVTILRLHKEGAIYP